MSSVSHKSDQSMQVEFSEMGAVASIAAFSRVLIKREQFRSGGTAETAIAAVARRLNAGPVTIANIVRNRVKSVCFSLGQRIIATAISDIENERKQLEHEREILLAMAAPTDTNDLAAVEAAQLTRINSSRPLTSFHHQGALLDEWVDAHYHCSFPFLEA